MSEITRVGMLRTGIRIIKLKGRGNRLKSFIILLAIGITLGMRAANSSCPELLNHEFPKLQDDTPQNLCMYENSVVLVVNTASFCGFTKQYEGLENLYKKYKSKGLVVLGFPSGNFRNQEYSSNKKIAEFCITGQITTVYTITVDVRSWLTSPWMRMLAVSTAQLVEDVVHL